MGLIEMEPPKMPVPKTSVIETNKLELRIKELAKYSELDKFLITLVNKKPIAILGTVYLDGSSIKKGEENLFYKKVLANSLILNLKEMKIDIDKLIKKIRIM